MQKIPVDLPSYKHRYDLLLGEDLLESETLLTLCFQFHPSVAIITDDEVRKQMGDSLCSFLKEQGLQANVYSFPPGEASKDRPTKVQIEDRMFSDGFSKDTTVIGLGGGVVMDLSGYIAATFCRGVPLILCPTTLLAMVDASIGGKTGVNIPQGKNLVGAQYHPHAVLMDISTLKSLGKQEIKHGLSEMVKHGAIASRPAFEFLEKHPLDDKETLLQAISDSCRIKRDVVIQDHMENGKRRILNFGHTIGHAFEAHSNYSLPHGQAVGLGAMIESRISNKLGFLDDDQLKRIHQAFDPLRPEYYKIIDPNELIESLRLDKKAQRGTPRFVILNEIGQVNPCDGEFCMEVDPTIVNESIQEVLNDLYRH